MSFSDTNIVDNGPDLAYCTPNITNLVAGADTFGGMANDTNSSIAGTDIATLVEFAQLGGLVIPQNAIGVVVRANQSVISSM
ncbi:MAG TPA: hypothetical protein VGR14_07985, partial [Verrucomicrobiae bacterium]|nr:hypothetical protein [Verrucomicrobiae bacterium]